MTNTVLGAAVTQTVTAFSTSETCGTITHTLITAESFITLDEATLTITVAPTLASQVGTYSVDLQAYVVEFPSILTTVTF